jgi:hypothetical protein
LPLLALAFSLSALLVEFEESEFLRTLLRAQKCAQKKAIWRFLK